MEKIKLFLSGLKTIIIYTYKFFKDWNEFITLPIAILLLIFVAPLIRSLDPTAGVFDMGVLQKPLLVIIYIFFYHAIAWFMLKVTFPNVYKFLSDMFEGITSDSQSISTWQKIQVSLCLFFFYFFMLVLVSLSV
jgi:hypothetical protein